MSSRWGYGDDHDSKIRQLEDNLFTARMTIISLVSKDLDVDLKGYYSCDSRDESYRWMKEVVDKVVEQAVLIEKTGSSYFQDRAYCPLCQDSSGSWYEEGYSIPTGLQRHLSGFGNVHQCPVMEVSFSLAHEYWREKFSEGEAREREEEQARLSERREIEILYKRCPTGDPGLVDEGVSWNGYRQ
ncbi:hypothetical protein JYU12_00730 [bacterium AH-315-K03]|nr:hypothetical protein [bacterium AH-315-K03]